MSRKSFIIIGTALLAIASAIILVRIISPEDDWVCSGGAWVRHGNPISSTPTTSCR